MSRCLKHYVFLIAARQILQQAAVFRNNNPGYNHSQHSVKIQIALLFPLLRQLPLSAVNEPNK